MKIEMFLLNMIIIAAVVVPFIMLAFTGKTNANLIKKRFRAEAGRLGLKVNVQHSWNTNMFGYDDDRKTLLLVKERKGRFETEVMEFLQLRSSRLLIQHREIESSHGKEEVLARIDLELLYHSGENRMIQLFDFDLQPLQDYELKNAEKLQSVIAENLSKNTDFRRSA